VKLAKEKLQWKWGWGGEHEGKVGGLLDLVLECSEERIRRRKVQGGGEDAGRGV